MQSGRMMTSAQPKFAQDPGEPFDIITADGKPTGRVKSARRFTATATGTGRSTFGWQEWMIAAFRF